MKYLPRMRDFSHYCRSMILGKGSLAAAIEIAENMIHSGPAATMLKAAVTSGTTTDPTWAAALLEHRNAVEGLVESMASIFVFDAMYESMIRLPLRTQIAVSSIIADAGTGQAISIGRLTLAASVLEPRTALAMVVFSDELSRASGPAMLALFDREIPKATGAATDRQFLGELSSAVVSPVVSTALSAPEIYDELAALAAAVSPTGTSRLFLIIDPLTAVSLSFKTTMGGALAFPDMTPAGGQIAGITVLVTDQFAADSSGAEVLMIDALAIAAGQDTVVADVAKNASLQMSNNPTNGENALVSLFQTNSIALRLTRYFGFELLRENGLAKLIHVHW